MLCLRSFELSCSNIVQTPQLLQCHNFTDTSFHCIFCDLKSQKFLRMCELWYNKSSLKTNNSHECPSYQSIFSTEIGYLSNQMFSIQTENTVIRPYCKYIGSFAQVESCPEVIKLFMPPPFEECGRALSVAHVRAGVRASIRSSII